MLIKSQPTTATAAPSNQPERPYEDECSHHEPEHYHHEERLHEVECPNCHHEDERLDCLPPPQLIDC